MLIPGTTKSDISNANADKVEEKSYTKRSEQPVEDDVITQKVEPKIQTNSSSLIQSVDFVLVYDKKHVNEEAYNKIETFVFNLEHKGFLLESTPFSANDDINFIKIHAPTEILVQFAELFGIELTFQRVDYKIRPSKPYKFMATELTVPDPFGAVFARARDTILGITPRTITNAEKGLVIYKVLSQNPFGDSRHEYGIDKLINGKVFLDAYPLHDGSWKWTEEGPLNDRQLLARYWSNLKCWYKQQPLDVIEQYYGPEASFYFAWVGFYNKMLLPASAIGSVLFFLGMISFYHTFTVRNKEICESNLLLCPRCLAEHCKYEPLENSCFHAKLMYLLDNPLVITFAALMSIWSTIFLELWRREEAMLQIRWNLRSVEVDSSMRPEFEEKATNFRFSTITGSTEPYMPKKQLCYRYAITSAAIILLIILMVLGILAVMIYVKTVSVVLTTHADEVKVPVGLVASVSGSMISVCLILVFEMFYEKIAMWLTRMENPRTQIEFDNSFTYKSYALAFVNNYSVIFYLAFLKARFYTYPGDKAIFKEAAGIGSDLCDPSGCIVELSIQLFFILMAKRLVLTAKQYIVPQLKLFLTKFRHRKTMDPNVTLQWEKDYLLNAVIKYHMMSEYMSMIIQYGFVTFFVAAFPPAPLLALFNNLIELRVDAFKMTNAFRRPVAFKVPSLAAWNGILQGITYIGVATNAFVIAFTSEFVQREIYRHSVKYNLEGYITTLLSVYNVSEFPFTYEARRNVSVCYYPGKRYPPDHPLRYQLTDDHWYTVTVKFLAVVLFEHIVMLITGIIAYVIPDIPFSVKEHINFQRDQLKEIKLKTLHDTYLKQQETDKANIFSEI
ncbi:hypothetical protein Zmor_027980 [Zophobas morio]|uniref:Anoctamin n=1 Tax=Zophobas morio TaxID=2755281 RepID=A0AA38HPP1_9CUCU|nr:hypothetical protein Zmor_027980 [Zophobas morio]